MNLSSLSRGSLCAMVAVAALGLAACGHKSPITVANSNAAAPAAGGAVVVPAGTVFYGKLNTAIGSKTSKDGDTFTLTPSDSLTRKNNAALEGATIEGHVDGVTAAGLAKKPAMTIVFDDAVLPDGNKDPVQLSIVSTKAFDPKTHHLRTLGLMAGGAVAGHAAAGAHHGGLLGAAGGYVLSQEMKTDIAVPAGTVIEVRFTAPLTDAGASQAPQ